MGDQNFENYLQWLQARGARPYGWRQDWQPPLPQHLRGARQPRPAPPVQPQAWGLPVRGRYIFDRLNRDNIYIPLWPRVNQRGRRAGLGRRRPPPQEPAQPEEIAPEEQPEIGEPAAEDNEIPAQQPEVPGPQDLFFQVVLQEARADQARRQNVQNRAELRAHELNRDRPQLIVVGEHGPLGPAPAALEQRLRAVEPLGPPRQRLDEPGELARIPIPERADGIVDEPIEYPVEDVAPEPLPVPNYPREQPVKNRVLFKGEKSKQIQNSRYTAEDAPKPVFKIHKRRFSPTKRTQRLLGELHWNSLFKNLSYGDVDEDLLAELWLEAAFQPRSPRLLIQLKNKAKRFMADWDTSLYTRMQCVEMALKAVGAAMTISPFEEEVRQLLMQPVINKLMLDHEKFTRGYLKAGTLLFGQKMPGGLSDK